MKAYSENNASIPVKEDSPGTTILRQSGGLGSENTAYRFHLRQSRDTAIQIAVAYSENMLHNYRKEGIQHTFPPSSSYHIYSFYGETHQIRRYSVCVTYALTFHRSQTQL